MQNFENIQDILNMINKGNDHLKEYGKYCDFGAYPFGLDFSQNQAQMFEGLRDNILFFLTYYSHFCNIALSRYSWTIPEDKASGVSADFIEKMNFFRGSSCVVRDNLRGFISASYCVKKTNFNNLFEPLEIEAIDYATGKTIGTYRKGDFVLIKNNFLAYPLNLTIMKFCAQIANLDIAEKINTFSQQIPILLQGDEKQKKTLQEFVAKLELGERYVFIPKDSVVKDVTSLDIRQPFIAKELLDIKDRNINTMLTLMGINNENVNKESGISSDEVNANDEFVRISGDIYSLARDRAVKDLQSVFGLEVSYVDNYAKTAPSEADADGDGDSE